MNASCLSLVSLLIFLKPFSKSYSQVCFVPQLMVYLRRRGKPTFKMSFRISSFVAPLCSLNFSRMACCCSVFSSFQFTVKTDSASFTPSSFARCVAMLCTGTMPSGKTSPQSRFPSTFNLTQVLYLLQSCNLRLICGFGFEILSVDFVLAIYPIGVAVACSMVAFFDCGV